MLSIGSSVHAQENKSEPLKGEHQFTLRLRHTYVSANIEGKKK